MLLQEKFCLCWLTIAEPQGALQVLVSVTCAHMPLLTLSLTTHVLTL
jgi:hypothetical protein